MFRVTFWQNTVAAHILKNDKQIQEAPKLLMILLCYNESK